MTGSEVTGLLEEIRMGSRSAADQLLPIVYAELRRRAAYAIRRERLGHTLDPTALVHEAYIELVGQNDSRWEGRTHFVNIASYLMRQVLVGHARKRRAGKREGAMLRVSLDADAMQAEAISEDVLAVHEALERLALFDERMARIVELRYFGGLSIAETAELVELSTATVEREWRTARAWLHQELTRDIGLEP